MEQIGRLWHRMYPKVRLVKDPENLNRPKPLMTRQYVKLLAILPDSPVESGRFLQFLNSQQKLLRRLWPADKS